MRLRRLRWVVLGVGWAALLSGAAGAQEARKVERVDTVTVSEVDPSQQVLEVRTGEGATIRFAVDEATRIRVGADALALEDLEPGDRVTVDARPPVPGAVGDRLIADVVTVVVEEEGSTGAAGEGPGS